MTMNLAWYWSIRNEHLEVDEWARTVLQLPGEAEPGPEIACLALSAVGALVLRRTGVDLQALLARILAIYDEHRPDDSFTVVVLATLRFFGVTGERELPEPADPWTRAMVGLVQVVLNENAGQLDESGPLLDDTIDGFRACGDSWGLATVLSTRGMREAADGDFDRAQATWAEALPLLERLGAVEDVAFTRMRITSLRLGSADDDDLAQLRADLNEQRRRAARDGDRPAEALARMGLAQLERRVGDHRAAVAQAIVILEQAAPLTAFAGGQFEAMIRAGYALSLAACGDDAPAAEQLRLAVETGAATQDMPVIAYLATVAANLVHGLGDDVAAARLLGAAHTIRGREDRSNHEAVALGSVLRQRLGDAAYDAAYDEGAALDRPAAVALVTQAQALRR
jgi:hypothetical protein